MTVKSRLLISHLIMFIVPIFMAVIVARYAGRRPNLEPRQ